MRYRTDGLYVVENARARQFSGVKTGLSSIWLIVDGALNWAGVSSNRVVRSRRAATFFRLIPFRVIEMSGGGGVVAARCNGSHFIYICTRCTYINVRFIIFKYCLRFNLRRLSLSPHPSSCTLFAVTRWQNKTSKNKKGKA